MAQGSQGGLRSPLRPTLRGGLWSVAGRVAQVASFQRVCLKEFLARNGGNITRAAEAAGKSRRAFFELLRKHHLTQPTFRARSGRNTISPP